MPAAVMACLKCGSEISPAAKTPGVLVLVYNSQSMTESIEFTLLQRISAEAILSQQRGTVGDLAIAYDITKKLKVEDRSKYIKELPNGQAMMDVKAVEEAENTTITLEKAERRKLLSTIKEHSGMTVNDLSWASPLIKKLETSLED